MNTLIMKEEITRTSTNPAHSANGGDYDFWTERYYDLTGKLVHTRMCTSADFQFNQEFGAFSRDPESDEWLAMDRAIRYGEYIIVVKS